MAEDKPTCFSSIQEGKGAQGNMANVNQKGKPMSGGQGVKRIRDYFLKSEANLNNGEKIKGKPDSKLASVGISKQLDSVLNPEEEVQARSEGSKVD